MTTTEKLTIDDMVRRAVDDRLYMEAMDQGERSYMEGNRLVIEVPPPVGFLPGTGLSHGLASVLKQTQEADRGIFWLLVAIASWVSFGGERSEQDGFDDDLMNQNTYADLLEKYYDMRDRAQFFELSWWGEHGAQLFVRGGLTATEDDSQKRFPIQRWHFTDFPWGRGPFGVWVFREQIGDRKVWTLMLPAEY
jgi:hypothetical protein